MTTAAPAVSTSPPQGAQVIEFADGIVEGSEHPLIPDGVYAARYTGHDCVELLSFRNAPRVFVHFKIVEPGPEYGMSLFRAYSVRKIRRTTGQLGAPIRNGRFVLGARSDLMKMICHVLDLKQRPDRVSLRALKQHVLRIRTRTVVHDSKQRPLPLALRYSVVDEVIGRETGR